MNEHIRHLEEKIAHLEHHVTQQDKAMLEFAEELARMRREMLRLVERTAGGSPSGGEGETLQDERPPHY